MRNMNYINSTMDELDSLNRDLYEALSDGEFKEVQSIIKKIRLVLNDIKESYLDEEVY